MRVQMRMSMAAAVAAAVLLSGCATSYVVDNQVQTFSELRTVPQPATYRFERLPSQQSAGGAQLQLEAAAEPALAKAGWVRNDGAARYSVLIGSDVVTTTKFVDPWVYSRCGPWGPYYGRR